VNEFTGAPKIFMITLPTWCNLLLGHRTCLLLWRSKFESCWLPILYILKLKCVNENTKQRPRLTNNDSLILQISIYFTAMSIQVHYQLPGKANLPWPTWY